MLINIENYFFKFEPHPSLPFSIHTLSTLKKANKIHKKETYPHTILHINTKLSTYPHSYPQYDKLLKRILLKKEQENKSEAYFPSRTIVRFSSWVKQRRRERKVSVSAQRKLRCEVRANMIYELI